MEISRSAGPCANFLSQFLKDSKEGHSEKVLWEHARASGHTHNAFGYFWGDVESYSCTHMNEPAHITHPSTHHFAFRCAFAADFAMYAVRPSTPAAPSSTTKLHASGVQCALSMAAKTSKAQ